MENVQSIEVSKSANTSRRTLRLLKDVRGAWKSAVAVVFAAIVGAAFATYNGRIRYVNYFVTASSGIVKAPELAGHTLDVQVDKKSVTNLSTVHLTIVNSSDKNLKEAEVVVRMIPDKPPLGELISATIGMPPDKLDLLDDPLPYAGGIAKRYKIHLANSGDTMLQCDYVFSGAVAPNLVVEVNVEGISANKIDVTKARESSNRAEVWITYLVFPLICVLFVINQMLDGRYRRSLERQLLALSQKQADDIVDGSIKLAMRLLPLGIGATLRQFGENTKTAVSEMSGDAAQGTPAYAARASAVSIAGAAVALADKIELTGIPGMEEKLRAAGLSQWVEKPQKLDRQ